MVHYIYKCSGYPLYIFRRNVKNIENRLLMHCIIVIYNYGEWSE